MDERELATVLAALRFWQSNVDMEDTEEMIGHGHFTEHHPLCNEEIDCLCEKLNTETPLKQEDGK